MLKQYNDLLLRLTLGILLILLPIFLPPYHHALYAHLILIAVVAVGLGYYIKNAGKKGEDLFLQKWSNTRNKGFKGYLALTSIYTGLWILSVILFSQFFWDGRTPWEIFTGLTQKGIGALVLVLFLILSLSIAAGAAGWHERERRYFRLKNEREFGPSR